MPRSRKLQAHLGWAGAAGLAGAGAGVGTLAAGTGGTTGMAATGAPPVTTTAYCCWTCARAWFASRALVSAAARCAHHCRQAQQQGPPDTARRTQPQSNGGPPSGLLQLACALVGTYPPRALASMCGLASASGQALAARQVVRGAHLGREGVNVADVASHLAGLLGVEAGHCVVACVHVRAQLQGGVRAYARMCLPVCVCARARMRESVRRHAHTSAVALDILCSL